MTTTIITRNSTVSGETPSVSDLVNGELALNIYDATLYTKKVTGTGESIIELAGNGAHAPYLELIGTTGLYDYVLKGGDIFYFKTQALTYFALSVFRPILHWMPLATTNYDGDFTVSYAALSPYAGNSMSGVSTVTASISGTYTQYTAESVQFADIPATGFGFNPIVWAKVKVTLPADRFIVFNGIDWVGNGS